MKILRTIEQYKTEINQERNKSIGFVPTMGYLHDGHLSLVRHAKQENDLVAMSIFVNPLQFGPNEDFERYPRDEKRDIELAKSAGVDLLFLPTVDVMYPEEIGVEVKVLKGTDKLCGKSRPGHFDGVATVVAKLFHIIEPNSAYFGLKDAQQVAVIHTLIKDLNFPIQLVGLPTVRESDGLAKSSRNVYLSEKERQEAVAISESLQFGRNLIANGEKNPSQVVAKVNSFLKEKTSGEIDYIEIYSYPELESIQLIERQIILAVAIFYNKARLIDNLIIDQTGQEISKFIK